MAKRLLISLLLLVALVGVGLTSCVFGEDDQATDDQVADDQVNNQAADDQAAPDQAVVVPDSEPPKPKDMDHASETVIIIGTSHDSWEDAVHAAVEKAEKCYKDVEIVQIGRLDAKIEHKDKGPAGIKEKEDKDKIEFTAAVEFSYKEDENATP